MFYLFHGADEYRRSLQLATMKAKLGDLTTVALNTTELNGRRLTLDELISVCDALPFLSEKRMVIVNDLAARFERDTGIAADNSEEGPAFLEQFEAYVNSLPESTRLVLIEDHKIKKSNPIHKIVSHSDHGHEHEFTPLRSGELSRWISERVEEKGGRIERAAIEVLAAFVGSDLRLLVHEIDKLLTYVGPERAVTEQDVQLLVSYAQEANIFDMVDALGKRDTCRAMELLEQLLEGGRHPLYLLNMITRQFRILIQVKELLAKGTSVKDIQALLRLHPYVVKKSTAQAANFSILQLEAIFRQLHEVDAAVKSGEMEPTLALNLFVTEVRSQAGGG
ncbi:MAG: DNA polymerase III subunit delta [Anaerolineae bacterium]